MKQTYRLVFIFQFIFWASVQVLQAQDVSRMAALLAEADAGVQSGNPVGALEKTEQALAIDRNHLPALQKRIQILLLMNNLKDAAAYADEAVRQHSGVPELFYLRGTVNNAREKYPRALDDFNEAIALNPAGNPYRYYLGRGVTYLNLLEYESALADLNESIELNDTVASAYHSRGMVNYELKEYASAVNDFTRALDYSEGNAVLYFNLAMSYFRLDEKEKSCPYFHKSCAMGNTNACRMAMMECARSIPTIR